jgi:hypothetical protein
LKKAMSLQLNRSRFWGTAPSFFQSGRPKGH